MQDAPVATAGVETVASFVGILGFVGQAVNGLGKLTKFFHDVRKAPKHIKTLLKNIESLKGTLSEVEQLLTILDKKQANPTPRQALPNVSVLQSHVKDCSNDINQWVSIAAKADPSSWNGVQAFFRRACVRSPLRLTKKVDRAVPCSMFKCGEAALISIALRSGRST